MSIFDLIAAFNQALKRVEVKEVGEAYTEKFTVADKIDAIFKGVKERGKMAFSGLLAGMGGRHEVVCAFLAVLELIRLRQIRAVQEGVSEKYLLFRLLRPSNKCMVTYNQRY